MGDHEAHGREADVNPVPGPDAEAAEAGRKLFAQECRFVSGAASYDGLPDDRLPEVAFAGRSNVGKSSLINALTGRKTLARTSNTPGRTRQINFFDLGGRLMLVDLPGYGYARAAKTEVRGWTRLIESYLKGRVGLRRLCLLIDGRHGLKPSDEDIMTLLDVAAVTYRVVLTKCDKVRTADLAAHEAAVRTTLAAHPAALQEPILTSAEKGTGIEALRADLAALASAERMR
jgi:GTP-binding protein